MLSIDRSKKLILASSSPRRVELLKMCGVEFETLPSQFDEESVSSSTPRELVEKLSYEKAALVSGLRPDAYVLGADTVVVFNNTVLGKPRDRDDAIRILSLLQGNEHQVWSAFTIIGNFGHHTEAVMTKVVFAPLTEKEISAYVDTHEPMDKAGAYGAQGIGATFISKIEGSYTNVIGLPVVEVIAALKSLQVVL